MFIKNEDLLKILIDKGLLKEDVAKGLLEMSERKTIPVEELIEEKGIIQDEEIGKILSELYGKPYIRLGDQTIKEGLLTIIPYQMANHQLVIPFEQYDGRLKVAFNNPHNVELISFIENKTGLLVEPYYATKKDIKLALKVYNRDVNEKFNKLLKGAMSDIQKIESLEDASKILDTIILFAYQNEASDIHIEPSKDFIIVRYRIDGILHTITELPIQILDLLVTRIKVLSNLRTDEHRSAQDGRIKIDLENNEITLRVSILPTYDGEKTVMRILSSTQQELNL